LGGYHFLTAADFLTQDKLRVACRNLKLTSLVRTVQLEFKYVNNTQPECLAYYTTHLIPRLTCTMGGQKRYLCLQQSWVSGIPMQEA
jgi:hypothetical protein